MIQLKASEKSEAFFMESIFKMKTSNLASGPIIKS
jgi:hypothetical protein